MPALIPEVENLKKVKPKTSFYARTTETFLGVEKVITDDIYVISDSTGYKSYNFKIDNSENPSKFENLHLIETENGFLAYIMSYEPESLWLETKLKSDNKTVFLSSFEGNITKYSLERDIIYSLNSTENTINNLGGDMVVECIYSTYVIGCLCHVHDDGTGYYGCECRVWGMTSSCSTYPGGGGSTSSSSGSNSPSGGGGTSTSNPNNSGTSGTLVVGTQPLSGIGSASTPNPTIVINLPSLYDLFLNELKKNDFKYGWFVDITNITLTQIIRDYLNNVDANIEFAMLLFDFLRNDSLQPEDIELIEQYLTLNTEESLLLAELTINRLDNQVQWTANSGNYNNIPSLFYTHTRVTNENGRPCYQYLLTNGDTIATMDYGQYQDIDWKTLYYSNDLKEWYFIPTPYNSTYNHLDLDFIFNGFWSVVQTTTRYCTPLEDIIVLIDGRDFDGVATSKAAAGIFILVDIIPGGKVLKITRKAGHTLSATSPTIKLIVNNLYKTQRNIRKEFKTIISGMNSTRKGNFGEICTDLDFYEKGYEVVNINRITNIDQAGHQGIDHIFKNPQTGEFVIVESKFHGTGGLNPANPATGLAPQMSDAWISNGQKNNTDRLWVALGGNLSLYNQIRPNATTLNYTRVVSYVLPKGTINYKYVSPEGVEISTVFSN